MDELTPKQIESFWARYNKSAPNGCWEWTKGQEGPWAKFGNGYGVVWFNGKRYKCHRLAFHLTNHDPGKLLVCHKCDNPKCGNPAHLFLGTPMENVRDCISKNRMHKESGSQRYNAKLTEADVAEIKAQAPHRKYGWGRMMARKYGVAPTAINNIIMGRRWKQVAPAKEVKNIHEI